MLLLAQKGNASLVFTFSLLLLFAPFQTVALVPVVAYLCFRKSGFDLRPISRSMGKAALSLCTAGNLGGIALMVLTGTFYLANNAVSIKRFLPPTPERMILFSAFMLLEFVVYFPFIFNKAKNDAIFWILMAVTTVCSFISLGNSHDFGWRTCIPFAFYLMLYLMRFVEETKGSGPLKARLLIVVLCLGAITPLTEMLRTSQQTISVVSGESAQPFISDGLASVFDDSSCYDNFVGAADSLFCRWFGRY